MFLSEPREGAITFGQPGDNRSYAELLADMPPFTGADLPSYQGDGKVFRELFTAAERRMRLVDLATGNLDALGEAADNRIRTVQQQTGVQLENPFRQGYHLEAQRRYDDLRGRGEDPGPRGPAVTRLQRDIFNEKLDDVATNFPDKAPALSFYQPMEDSARAIAKGAAEDARRAEAAAADEPVGMFMTELAAGLYASRRDPLMVTSLFFGPTTAAGKLAVTRVASSALNQGLFNAGLSAIEQPAVQSWRKAIGERSGVMPAVEEVGFAFVLGAIPGAALRGGYEALTASSRAALERVARGAPEPGDIAIATQALKTDMAPVEARAVIAGEASGMADEAAGAGAPAGLPGDRASEISAQAIRHGEDPINEPPPELALPVTARPADQVKLLDEGERVTIGARETVDGKPVTFARFDPAALTTDATTFQYKGGSDAKGVTDRLRFVERWDPTASGKAFVFERADGAQVIADGHQRLGLAERVRSNDPQASVKLDGFLFREKDGWRPADVRALAAKKNMQEGAGDALDAARILRERPDLLDGALPVSSPMMKNAVALSRLSDEAFGMAINGVVPPNYAAAVGAMVPDQLQHAAVMADLARFAPETEREARLLIGEAMAAGFTAEHQINLFGAGEAVRSLMGERVKTLDAALTALIKDKKLFGTLAEKADAIEAAGNRLARGVNEQRATDAAALADLVTRLAQRTGPVSDALNHAAAMVADKQPVKVAAESFLDTLRALLDKDGLPALLASPELKPRTVVEPGTPEALALAETAIAERTDAGDQLLMPGVAAVTEKQKLELQAAKPLQGGEQAPPTGGLFDENITAQADLIDSIAVAARADGKDTRFISREAALADAEKPTQHADLLKECKA